MATQDRPVRISYKVLVSLTLAAIPLLAVIVYFGLGIGEAELRTAVSRPLGEIAERTAASIDSYVFRRIQDVSVMAKVPEVRRAAAASSDAPFDMTDTERVDRLWQRGDVPPPGLEGFFDRPVSMFLQEVSADDPLYVELMLTDAHGRLIAASGATSDYYQADEQWWTTAYGDGLQGRVFVGDVERDLSARVFAADVAVPVTSQTRDRVVGVLRVLLDSREMFAAVAGTGTVQAALVRTDATLVFSHRRADPTESHFFAEQELREQLARDADSDTPRGFSFAASAADGSRYLVAVARSQLGSSYATLPWVVAVYQPEAEILAPLRAQATSLLLALAFTALIVLALGFWFSFRLTSGDGAGDLDMHLVDHPKTPHLEEDV